MAEDRIDQVVSEEAEAPGAYRDYEKPAIVDYGRFSQLTRMAYRICCIL